ncbi:LLM class flavin-dependent oxidoreductase [Actinoplanes sp. N902-109]|uniref:LLM class flavin-dependent oxidoreductase n=1 Tax=Actinoplanes sp. (strain N902-109) TaxID=649831 RepID=UPI0003294771|nr:LLM class flavin-dependent oxidoreductase [Actinoplanes sp. N902-109]AGL15854.1 F420-dependent dehydrogenase [Actinoplanes sp. N902-109]
MTPMPVRVGVLLPTREQAMIGSVGIPPLVTFARTAEELGFDAVWTGDSLTARARLDPMVVLAAVGTATERIGVGTAALTPALRPPVVAANMLAALDHATGARLTLGVGSGFPIAATEEEFALVGVPFQGRAGRLDETVQLWRRSWAGPGAAQPAAFTGRHVSATGLDRLPPPLRPGGPAVWLAASDTPAVLQRVARHYDGWMPFLPSAAAYATAWQRITTLAAAAGRPAGAITPSLYATVAIGADQDAARAGLEDYVGRYYGRSLADMSQIQAYCWGSVEDCARWLRGYVRAGARDIVLRIGSLDPEPQLKEIAATLLPAVRAAVGAGEDSI